MRNPISPGMRAAIVHQPAPATGTVVWPIASGPPIAAPGHGDTPTGVVRQVFGHPLFTSISCAVRSRRQSARAGRYMHNTEGIYMRRDVRLWRSLGILVAALALTTPALASAVQQGAAKKVNYHAFYTTSERPFGQLGDRFQPRRERHAHSAQGRPYGRKGDREHTAVRLPDRRRLRLCRPNPDGKLLFVMNAGDNSVSSFRDHGVRAEAGRPRLLAREAADQPDQQRRPSSWSTRRAQNIFGWHFSSTGKLTPIAGSDQQAHGGDAQGQEGQGRRDGGYWLRRQRRVVAVTQRGLPREVRRDRHVRDQQERRGRVRRRRSRPRASTNVFGFSSSASRCL